jgi:hypothetical protein
MAPFVFAMPSFERILYWVAQLPDGGPEALAQLQVESDRSNAIFV